MEILRIHRLEEFDITRQASGSLACGTSAENLPPPLKPTDLRLLHGAKGLKIDANSIGRIVDVVCYFP